MTLGHGIAFIMGGAMAFGLLILAGKMLFEHAMSIVFDDDPRVTGSHADEEKDKSHG